MTQNPKEMEELCSSSMGMLLSISSKRISTDVSDTGSDCEELVSGNSMGEKSSMVCVVLSVCVRVVRLNVVEKRVSTL